MRNLLKLAEIDSEYGVKSEFVRGLVDRYGLLHMGIGEALYAREDLEAVLRQHALDGRPTLAAMAKEAKAMQDKALQDAASLAGSEQ